jgi:hypothetical protein
MRIDELHPMLEDSLANHIEVLRSASPGAPIKFLAPGDRVHDGRWRGIEVAGRDGEERVCFELRRNETRKLPIARALDVRLTGESNAGSRLQARTVRTSPLLRAIRGHAASVTFVTTARCDVVLVGTLAALEPEMTEEPLLPSGDESEFRGGVLQDIARVQQFRDGRRFHRAIAVPSLAEPSVELKGHDPKVVVMDGGRAFLRFRHMWPNAHRVVVLDRSTLSAEDAGPELAGEYAYAETNTALMERLRVPDGVEFVAYSRLR